jgi:hypothetical protein
MSSRFQKLQLLMTRSTSRYQLARLDYSLRSSLFPLLTMFPKWLHCCVVAFVFCNCVCFNTSPQNIEEFMISCHQFMKIKGFLVGINWRVPQITTERIVVCVNTFFPLRGWLHRRQAPIRKGEVWCSRTHHSPT